MSLQSAGQRGSFFLRSLARYFPPYFPLRTLFDPLPLGWEQWPLYALPRLRRWFGRCARCAEALALGTAVLTGELLRWRNLAPGDTYTLVISVHALSGIVVGLGLLWTCAAGVLRFWWVLRTRGRFSLPQPAFLRSPRGLPQHKRFFPLLYGLRLALLGVLILSGWERLAQLRNASPQLGGLSAAHWNALHLLLPMWFYALWIVALYLWAGHGVRTLRRYLTQP